MAGTPEATKAWIRGYYAESTVLYLNSWGGTSHAFHLGLDNGTCATRDEALEASNLYLAVRSGVRRGTRVLDAGCGVGGSSMWLAKNRGASVVGITLAPEQVAIARQLSAEAGVDDLVEFAEMDFAATSFRPESFDVVWNLESMCHAFDKRAYLGHVRRLLRPGGKFVCLDMFTVPGGDASTIHAMCENWSLPSMPSVDEVKKALLDAGFVSVESEDLTSQVRRPVEALAAFARNTDTMLRLERSFAGAASAVHEAHVRGALACAKGVDKGTFCYAYVGASAPDVAPAAGAR
jgi:cyclopropane fatty-acyl-phospholipid synthase-like methyltransferase